VLINRDTELIVRQGCREKVLERARGTDKKAFRKPLESL
jgi:hypothetical protein